ncbi:Zinc finger, GRF-type [Sesbania bispinosa]|nr:Zinc finger, GRF-type [Sesbania bispinosa]
MRLEKTSLSSASSSRNRLCACGDNVLVLTSTRKNNPGRRFWRCPNWNKQETCNYFKWVDEDNTVTDRSPPPCTVYSEQPINMSFKIRKLQVKLDNERKKANLAIGLLLLTSIFAIGVLSIVLGKCKCLM